jgi:hypothetical protein
MGIKVGSYMVQPVHRVVRIQDKKPKTREERIQEHKNMNKALRMYTGHSIDVRI